MAEFLGRLPVRVELDPLTEDELVRVLTDPPDAAVREYKQLLALDGIDLQFTDEALRMVARFAHERQTGARALRSFIEELCHEIMFEAPERQGETIVIDGAAARTPPGPLRRGRGGAGLRRLRRQGTPVLELGWGSGACRRPSQVLWLRRPGGWVPCAGRSTPERRWAVRPVAVHGVREGDNRFNAPASWSSRTPRTALIQSALACGSFVAYRWSRAGAPALAQ